MVKLAVSQVLESDQIAKMTSFRGIEETQNKIAKHTNWTVTRLDAWRLTAWWSRDAYDTEMCSSFTTFIF